MTKSYILDSRKPHLFQSDKVMITGRGNTYKTTVALRMMLNYLLDRPNKGQRVSLTLICAEGNLDIEGVFRIAGKMIGTTSAEERSEAFEKLNVSFRFINATGLDLESLNRTLDEVLQYPGEHHLVFDGMELAARSGVVQLFDQNQVNGCLDILERFNGLKMAVVPMHRPGLVYGYTTYTAWGGPGFMAYFGLVFQTKLVTDDNCRATAEVIRGLPGHIGETLDYDFKHLLTSA